MIKSNNMDCLEGLLTHGPSPNQVRDWPMIMWQALCDASVSKNAQAVALLIQHGADPNLIKDGSGTPLHLASTKSCADLLLKSGTNPNIRDCKNQAPLHWAAMDPGYSPDVTTLLLQSGADPDLLDKYGATPLYYAASRRNVPACRLLLQAGANPNLRGNNLFQDTPLGIATSCLLPEAPSIVSTLLEAGANPNALHCGDSLILNCTDAGLLELLQEYGAENGCRDALGGTPLHQEYTNCESTAVLVRHMADVNSLDSSGDSPLDCAPKRSIRRLLTRHGAMSGYEIRRRSGKIPL